MGVFVHVVVVRKNQSREDTHPLFLCFPRPTAWMLFGVWPFPIYFVAGDAKKQASRKKEDGENGEAPTDPESDGMPFGSRSRLRTS